MKMLNRIFRKNEVLFAILWIVAYVVLVSAADNLSVEMGVEKLITVPVCGLLTGILVIWMKKNKLFERYGLCAPQIRAGKLWYYLPLVLLASVNMWFGVALNLSPLESMLYVVSMLFVGFLEEIIFRGLLFKAMEKDGIKAAVIVSSLTFGIGHLVNLVNGSGADLFSNLLQVGYAIAAGFAFTMLFYRSRSLWACMITHGVVNALSVFANEKAMTPGREMFSAAMLAVIALVYGGYLVRVEPAAKTEKSAE